MARVEPREHETGDIQADRMGERSAGAPRTLREDEQRLRLALDAGRMGAWDWEVGTDRVQWSDGHYLLLGYEPGEIEATPQAFGRRVHPEDHARQEQALWESVEKCKDYVCEFRVIWPDGSVHWLEARGRCVCDGRGKAARMYGVLTDIDARKRIEEALRQSEQRFRTLFEADLMGVYVTRPDGTFLDCNDKMVRMLGYDSREEVLRHRSTDFYVDPEFRAEAVRVLQRDGVFPGREGLLRRKDGAIIHVLGFAVLLRDERTGEPYIQGVAVDITDRKRAEEALVKAKEWNERNAARLDAVLHQMTEGLEIFDPAGNLLDMNRAALVIHGLDSVAELRQHFENLPEAFEMFDLEGRSLPMNEWPIARALRGETFQSCEVRVRCRRTGRTWVSSYGGTPVRDPDGRLIFAIVTLRDITAQKEAERQLRELTATLESKVAQRTAELEHRARQLQKLTLELSQAEDRERKRLAEILHDDLQQQLAAAKFHMGLLSNGVKDDPSLREISVQTVRMLKDAIEASRNLSHELNPAVMYHGDLGETFEWLAAHIRAKHGLIVHVHTDGEVNSQSETLKTFLYRAAQEMLFNVVKHAWIGQASVRIRRRGPSICLMVSDRGRGFDPQELKAVTGFGLFNIQERVQLLGGRMKIRSARGRGSTFFIAVPDEIVEPERAEAGIAEWSPPAAVSVEPEPAAAHPRPPLRVLIADDHEIVRQGLVSVLGETPDIEVVGEAGNGREAVDLACHLEPDVVVMDMAMPLMNGDEATRQIRRRLPQTRVIALSMYGEARMIERMRRAGAQAYVIKTAPSEELLAAIRNEPVCR